MTADGFVLTLRWTCRACGWSVVIDAPGFAGDGYNHFPDGSTPCGPLAAQRSTPYGPLAAYKDALSRGGVPNLAASDQEGKK